MRHQLFLALVLVFGLIGAIRTYSGASDEDPPYIHVNVKNEGTGKLEGLKARMFIYDLDVLLHANPFDLGKGDKDGKFIFLDDEDIAPGTYLARITVSNDNVREVKHRYITIG